MIEDQTLDAPAAKQPEQPKKESVQCNFCGKMDHNDVFMLRGHKAAICHECVELCVEMIRDHKPDFCKKDFIAG